MTSKETVHPVLVVSKKGEQPIQDPDQVQEPTIEQPKKIKSKHQQKRVTDNDNINESLKNITNEFNDKFKNIVNGDSKILETGQSDKTFIEEDTSILVRVNTQIILSPDLKIIPSIVSDDEDLGGLGIYVKEYKHGDRNFIVFVENNSGDRNFFINYIITE